MHEDRNSYTRCQELPCDELTSHQGRARGNTPSRFLLQKPEMTADTNESSGFTVPRSKQTSCMQYPERNVLPARRNFESSTVCQISELTRCVWLMLHWMNHRRCCIWLG